MQQNWLFGGVYGAVLSSALLAALHSEGTPFTPYYNAAWILVTAGTAALAHAYAHHMSSQRRGRPRGPREIDPSFRPGNAPVDRSPGPVD
ncbi:hypothetical protein [Streptomyces melanogenes]|uniref:Integral membrane protein n=1 Tax=Streptomyces melanogenes TaxID=67326 RepID=A0ABZ1XJB6_9ACTN|nr:hypothetical protein [Streptomyces melanogenes]